MIHYEDYEREAQKDLVYVQEDMHAFYQSLNDPGEAQIEIFMAGKVNLNNLKVLQDEAKINVCIPESLINKIDFRIAKNYEHKIDGFSFYGVTEKRV
jgi:hypothetical protein